MTFLPDILCMLANLIGRREELKAFTYYIWGIEPEYLPVAKVSTPWPAILATPWFVN
jgi:hypothetical protein